MIAVKTDDDSNAMAARHCVLTLLLLVLASAACAYSTVSPKIVLDFNFFILFFALYF